MAAIDFPAAPATNQLFAAPNGVVYQWTGVFWKTVVIGPVGFSVPALMVFSNQVTFAAGVAKPTMAAPIVDQGSYWNAGSSRWVPPAGNYLISGAATVTGASGTIGIGPLLYKNGAPYTQAYDTTIGAGGVGTGTFSVIVQANGSDFFELFCSGASQPVQANGTYLAAYGLSPTPGQSFATALAPTVQKFLSGSGTYVTPANCRWLRVRFKGGGGGGSGAPNSGGTLISGTDGGTTTFNAIVAAGGKGANLFSGGAGGTGGAGTATLRMPGAPGIAGSGQSSVGGWMSGPGGGSGGGIAVGGGASANAPGIAGAANGGGGGGGGYNSQGSVFNAGAGGGEGETVELLIGGPAANYNYVVGGGGAGGVSTSSGGAGGSGMILVEEYY